MMAVEFNFDNGCTTPYLSAPSSPRGFGNYLCYYTSAPTFPSSVAAIYNHFGAGEHSAENQIKDIDGSIGGNDGNEESEEFEFEIGRQSVVAKDEDHLIATADELFEAGKIRPLHPIRGRDQGREQDRGGRRTTARSLSPLTEKLNSCQESRTTTVIKSTTSKKWSFKDFFLFRSASEGRATGNRNDPLWKHTAALMTKANAKNSSFRSTDNGGSRSMRREVLPHERWKTFLPYRQELLGCLGFNPSIDGIAKAFGSITGGSSRGSKRTY